MSKRKRYLPLKGDKARRFKDRYTGKTISRRQYDKITGRKRKRKPGKPLSGYKRIRNAYMEKQGLKSSRQAMNSNELKKVVRDLRKARRLRKDGKIKEANELTLEALKKTNLRDGIPDSVPVGQSAEYTGAA